MAKQRRGAILQEPAKVKQPRSPLAWKKLFKHAAKELLTARSGRDVVTTKTQRAS